MSIVVMAYHEMGCTGLRLLLNRGVEVSAVFTYEDDPAENCWFGSVAALARSAGIPVFTPKNVNDPHWVREIERLKPGVIFSFYYRDLIRRPIRAIPAHGCVNLHGSLLPKYRGRSPLNWQLVNGETESGVTLHYITGRADAGDIIGQERVEVGPEDTAIILYRKLLAAAERLLHRHLRGVLEGAAPRRKQDESQATVFGRRTPEDGRLDWRRPAWELHNLVRAVAPPWPGAFTFAEDGKVMILRSRLCEAVRPARALKPGEVRVAEDAVFIGCGREQLQIMAYLAPSQRALRSGEILGDNRCRHGRKC
jgi:UDP-4-amino-4-deoxy-L-arabinose formyltransferase/UDP-glucuronic acid dehydrogenase (UDP-4-keto-hexauronic acid decarboxylating)